jgi:hypothetical protein
VVPAAALAGYDLVSLFTPPFKGMRFSTRGGNGGGGGLDVAVVVVKPTLGLEERSTKGLSKVAISDFEVCESCLSN